MPRRPDVIELYHARTSVCSIKARLALAEKGLEWTSRLLTLRGDQFDPKYMKLNPNAVVPTLVHDGNVVIESTVIMHYLDDTFADPALMPADPISRSKVRMMAKLMDEYVHNSCTVLTFATANRVHLTRLSAEEMEAELAKSPSRARADAKRQVVKLGLDAPLVVEAVHHHVKLLDSIEAAMADAPYIAGAAYSLADIAAIPYAWRLEKLRLGRMWADRPGVAAWYDRVRQRPSFTAAIAQWLTPAEIERYASFEPDPWPKVSEILQSR
jgi:glutathione S-transferase